MIKIAPKNLDASSATKLASLQSRIDAKTTFKDKAKKAQSSWDGKNADTFKKVADTLLTMTIANGVCNYCEQNESNDIEHIKPKSFFPAHTFDWENYILACKQCNSAHKIDKCFVFDQSNHTVFLDRGIEPISNDVAFINPRTDDPNRYMMIIIPGYTFEILPDLSPKEVLIAQKTIDILELNTRAVLLQARKNAEAHYFEKLDRLVRIRASRSKKSLKAILSPVDDLIDDTKSLKLLKSEITESYKNYIFSYQHPSIWHSIKAIQSRFDPIWKKVFDKIPEALNW